MIADRARAFYVIDILQRLGLGELLGLWENDLRPRRRANYGISMSFGVISTIETEANSA